MQQVEEDESKEGLTGFLQLRQVADEVFLNLQVALIGCVARRFDAQVRHVLEQHAGKGRILQRSTGVGTEVVAQREQLVNEYRTGTAGLEGCPVVRLQSGEHAEYREGGTIATADMVLIPLFLMRQLPQVGHALLGECQSAPRVDENHHDIGAHGLGGVCLNGMQWINQVATFALIHLHDVALKTHILQQVAGR